MFLSQSIMAAWHQSPCCCFLSSLAWCDSGEELLLTQSAKVFVLNCIDRSFRIQGQPHASPLLFLLINYLFTVIDCSTEHTPTSWDLLGKICNISTSDRKCHITGLLTKTDCDELSHFLVCRLSPELLMAASLMSSRLFMETRLLQVDCFQFLRHWELGFAWSVLFSTVWFPICARAGFSRIFGYPVGIIGNNGVLFSESAKKVFLLQTQSEI